jgi:hypothetical protein
MHARAMAAAPPPIPSKARDPLAAALLAAELSDPFPFEKLPTAVLRELFDGMSGLRISVPYATINLLERLIEDSRAEIRAGVARSLPWFADLYPERVERQLTPLASDDSRKVRNAVAEALADLIESSAAPWSLIARWERLPERARDVLKNARKSLPPPLGT